MHAFIRILKRLTEESLIRAGWVHVTFRYSSTVADDQWRYDLYIFFGGTNGKLKALALGRRRHGRS